MAIASKTGTLILTTKGLQSLEDLQVGDQVHTHMGRWRAIKQIVKRSSIQLRRIRTDGGLIITTTDDQPFLTRFKSYHWDNSLRQDVRQFTDPTWVNAKDLTINHFVGQILPDESQNEYTLDLWTDI